MTPWKIWLSPSGPPQAGSLAMAAKSGGASPLASAQGVPAGAVQNFGPRILAGEPPRLAHTGVASMKLPLQPKATRPVAAS